VPLVQLSRVQRMQHDVAVAGAAASAAATSAEPVAATAAAVGAVPIAAAAAAVAAGAADALQQFVPRRGQSPLPGRRR
jgi:hypothetical protein